MRVEKRSEIKLERLDSMISQWGRRNIKRKKECEKGACTANKDF